jgi:hypothetical protein
MWYRCSRPSELNYEDKMVLISLFKHSPILELAYQLYNDLTGIFDQHIGRVSRC